MSIRESDGSPAGLEYVARFPSADLIIVGCGAAGMTAAAGTLLPWAGATLSDRGAVLLAVSRTGLELSANGTVVLLLGVVCADPACCRRTGGVRVHCPSRWRRLVL